MNSTRKKHQQTREDELPTVLLHGATGRSEDYSQVVAELSKHREVIRPNYGERFCGDTQEAGPAMSDFGAGVIAEIRDTVCSGLVCLAHPLAPAVATRVAAEYPEMINSLVLRSGFSLLIEAENG